MYERALVSLLCSRLAEERAVIQIVLGPRQVGKTTAVRQALERVSMPWHYASADTAVTESPAWLEEQWARGRGLAVGGAAVLVIDEVQKVPDWSAWIKRLWDEDSLHARDLKVVLLGSSPLLMQQGLSESLVGRFETLPATHWVWAECRDAFGWDLDTWMFYGGYPGAARYVDEPERWRRFILDSIVETTVSRDVLLMTRVDKPALLRRVFALACEHSGRELTYDKMRTGLHDAGNTTTIAHYLDLLEGAGLMSALQKFSGQRVRRRRSTPKLAVHNTALMNAVSETTFEQARDDAGIWGRVVESAVGAHLIASARMHHGRVLYWRDGDREVDFVMERGASVTGIEVKAGRSVGSLAGLRAFADAYPQARTLVAGTGGVPLEEFLGGELVAL